MDKYRKIRKQVETEKPRIIARAQAALARRDAARRDAARHELARAFELLKRCREEQGLSLSDLQRLTGIDRSALSKLETGVRGNPTLDTLMRYAAAVGRRLTVSVADP